MKALKAFGEGVIKLIDSPIPTINDVQVRIRPLAVGFCATDIDIIENKIDPVFVNYPITIGHEWCGEIEEIGSKVRSVKVGDRAVVQGIIPCNNCRECKDGHTNRCEIYDEYGFTRDGAASGAVIAKEDLVYVLQSHVSIESGVLAEPAAVVTTGFLKSNPKAGSKVLVIGDGTIGLIAATLIRNWSPIQVDVLGLRKEQESLVRQTGADNFYTSEDEILALYDFVIEASGSKQGSEGAFRKIARGGTLLILGYIGHEVSIPVVIDDVVNGDFSIFASFGSTTVAWKRTVELLNTNKLDLTFLVTHRYPLADWERALDALKTAPAPRGKVLMLPQGE